MTEINLTGPIGEVFKLNYNGASLEVKLGSGQIVPDIVEAVILAIKADANAVLMSTHQLIRPNVSGENYARDVLGKAKEKLFAEIDDLALRSAPRKAAPAKKAKEPTEKKATTIEPEPVEEKPAEATPEVAAQEPAPEIKSEPETTTEKKAATTSTAKSGTKKATATKKTTTKKATS